MGHYCVDPLKHGSDGGCSLPCADCYTDRAASGPICNPLYQVDNVNSQQGARDQANSWVHFMQKKRNPHTFGRIVRYVPKDEAGRSMPGFINHQKVQATLDQRTNTATVSLVERGEPHPVLIYAGNTVQLFRAGLHVEATRLIINHLCPAPFDNFKLIDDEGYGQSVIIYGAKAWPFVEGIVIDLDYETIYQRTIEHVKRGAAA